MRNLNYNNVICSADWGQREIGGYEDDKPETKPNRDESVRLNIAKCLKKDFSDFSLKAA